MAVDHLADMLQHSTIAAADLAAERQVILEEINMHEDSPEDLVHDVFTEALWPGHPLGRPILGTEDRIARPTRASVRGFYRRHYVPGRMVVSAAGNVRHDNCSRCLRDRMDVGQPLARGADRRWTLRSTGARAEALGRDAYRARKPVEQAHIVPRHERPAPDRPGPLRLPHRQHGARRRDVLPPVPGDPGEARARLHRVQLPLPVHRGRRVQRVRGHDAGQGATRSSR